MKNETTPQNLLSTAQDMLRQQLAVDLPAAQKYQALMIASAMGIVSRQIEFQQMQDEAELNDLRNLLGVDSQNPDQTRPKEQLNLLKHALVEQIKTV